MHRLRKLQCTPSDHFKGIVESKRGAHRTVLDASLNRVLRQYQRFEQRFSRDDLKTSISLTWKPAEERSLLHCYTSEVAALTALKDLIRSAQPRETRSICPYCGIGAPVQFDHYLPKSAFPELAVHAYNLAPCCGPCNGLKGETWLVNGGRAFINLYVDSLPTAAVVQADITWRIYRGDLLPEMSFSLVRPAGFRRERFALVASHFDRLDLLERYRDQANTVFDDFRDNAIAREARSVAHLRGFLQRYIEKRAQTLGPLNWKLPLYQGLVAHTPFLRSCLP